MIAPATLRWSEGMAGWTAASETEAFGGCFRAAGAPPAYSASSPSDAPTFSSRERSALASSVAACGFVDWPAIAARRRPARGPAATSQRRCTALCRDDYPGAERTGVGFAASRSTSDGVCRERVAQEWVSRLEIWSGVDGPRAGGSRLLIVAWFVGEVRPTERPRFKGGFWGCSAIRSCSARCR